MAPYTIPLCQRCNKCCQNPPHLVCVEIESIKQSLAQVGIENGVIEATGMVASRPDDSCVAYDPQKGCLIHDKKPSRCEAYFCAKCWGDDPSDAEVEKRTKGRQKEILVTLYGDDFGYF